MWPAGYIASCVIGGAAVGIVALQWALSWRDRRLLDALKQRPQFNLLRTRSGARLAVRYTHPPADAVERRLRPVFIANGLAATMATTGAIHDALVAAGFTCCSYDRLGVGMSDPNPTGRQPTVDECMLDMTEVMDSVASSSTQWILLGPSMGSVVCQPWMARFPARCAGFLNMDGFAHPFYLKAGKFRTAGGVYWVLSHAVWTGVLRFGLLFAGAFFRQFATPLFDVATIAAQMNAAGFWYNTSLEMTLMTDLARAAADAWGAMNVAALPAETLRTLESARPAQNGEFRDGAWFERPRGRAEAGSQWAPPYAVAAARAELARLAPGSALGRLFAAIPVRVISARSYDYPGGDSFYDPEMKAAAAAEHAMHALVARDGARYVFPDVGHNKIFLHTDIIVQCAVEIDDAVKASSSSSSPSSSPPRR